MTKENNYGFGCYRIDNRIEEHINALGRALSNGVRLIDTSANYTDGRSEILVGNVLNDMLEGGKIKRDEVVIVTKGGYMQGRNYQFARRKRDDGSPFSDVVEYEEGLWHSISPDYLEDQINRQLYRLDQNGKGGYIDVYLLHNPEYYLNYACKNAYEKEDARKEYYHRIKKAFEFLEEKTELGKIKSYGISSNSFPHKSTNFDFTSLEKLLELASSVSSVNNFKVIQLPFNIIESDAYFEKNNCGDTKTVLELASERGIRVLVNRPLNAITQNGLVRLADFTHDKFDRNEFLKYLEVVELMEDDFLREKFRNDNVPENDLELLHAAMVAGRTLKNNWESFGTIEHFNDIVEHYFSHRINLLVDYFEEKVNDDDLIKQFDRYIRLVFRLLNMTSNYYKEFANRRSGYLHSVFDDFLSGEHRDLTLSQKAMLTVSSVPGVNCVLAGMRKEKYVDDVLGIKNASPVKQYDRILSKLREDLLGALMENKN
ncbi:MAG: aldo/keto reductase [Bacteroidetes bacterium]|nr:aldo/keto reductase [Bacteroidota bacterium]